MWIIIGMYLLLIPMTVVYLRYRAKNEKVGILSVVLKGSCTFIIILAALTALTVKGEGVSTFDWLIIAGLVFGLIGDNVIAASLLSGMMTFELGHICYMAAMIGVPGNHLWAIPIWVLTCVGLYIVYRKSGINLGKYRDPALIYGVIILMMLSLAFTVREVYPLLLPAAALLFTASDFVLAMILFGKNKSKKIHNYSFCLYLAGQSLFAISVIVGI